MHSEPTERAGESFSSDRDPQNSVLSFRASSYDPRVARLLAPVETSDVPTAWNLFRLGRAAGKEDQLTEMFAWLASAVPEVIPLIVRLAFEDVAAAAGRIEVSTQQAIVGGRLDAVFTSENTALVVESKLQSEYGEGQIRKYLDWLAEQHDERPHRGLMTLTANLAPWPKSEKEHAEAAGYFISSE